MTEISDELKAKILSFYTDNRVYFEERIKTIASDKSFIQIPVLIDGVVDSMRFNVAEGRFDQVTVAIADGDVIAPGLLGETAVFSDKVIFVTIPLPRVGPSEYK